MYQTPSASMSRELLEIMKTFKKNSRATIAVYEQAYNGKAYLHIREHYTDADGELRPTKKGVALDLALAEELIQALAQVVGTARNSPTPAKEVSPELAEALAAIPAKS